MRRRRRLTLFEKTEPDVYLFDTSAWLNIDSLSNREDIWAMIQLLVDEGRLFTCAQVLAELREGPLYLYRIKPMERSLLAGENNGDVNYLLRVGKITHDWPGMSKATSARTPADPYAVALALTENYVVVADETILRRKNRKIPGVCQQLGVRCITLAEFISAETKP